MDFWNDLTLGFAKEASSLDEHLGDRTSSESVRLLVERFREANGLPLPAEAGTRVAFLGNLGAVLSYPVPPEAGSEGTVVTVRSAAGDVTASGGLVFVKWDNGDFLPVHAAHLRAAVPRDATAFRRRCAFGDLGEFLKSSKSKDELVHKATKDLWAMRKEGDEYVIERLFDSSGSPLKV